MPDANEEPCPDDMEPTSPELLTFDYAVAEREGWTLGQTDPYPDGTPMVVIIRLLVPGEAECRFDDDGAARRHVAEHALQGSVLHRKAMSLVDRYEQFVAEALHGHKPE